MSQRNDWPVLLLAGMALVLAGCAAPAPTAAPAAAASTTVAGTVEAAQETAATIALVGTEWQLESIYGGEAAIPVVPGTKPTLGFAVDRYMGFGGCDYFVGAYLAKEDNGLDIQQPAITTGGCINEPKAMEQQGTYVTSLRNVISYAEKDGKLELYTTGDQVLMTMVPLQSVPLEVTTWDLSFYYDAELAAWKPVMPGARITAKFDGQQVSGNAGCNDYSAKYTLSNDRLTVDAIAVTNKTCAAPEGVMEQEQGYLAMLKTAGWLQKYPRSVQMFTADNTPLLMYHAGQ